MKSLDDLVSYYGEQLGCGESSVDSAILYSNLLTMKDICDSVEYDYKDTIQMLLNIIEEGFNPHSFSDTDIINHAKVLCKEPPMEQELYSFDKYLGYIIYIHENRGRFHGDIYFNGTCLHGNVKALTGESCLNLCKSIIDDEGE